MKLRCALASARAMALVAIFSVASTGCYRTRNIVHLSPLETSYPVSASSQYLDASGAIATPENYEVLSNFQFERTIEVSRHSQSEAQLKIESEVDQYVKQAGGDAVTHLKVVATDYHGGAHYSAASWKMMGWSFGLMGAPLLIIGAASNDSTLKSVFIPMGAAFMGVGAVSYALSFAANKPSQWKFQISGTVVRGGKAGTTGTESAVIPPPEAAPVSPQASDASAAPDTASSAGTPEKAAAPAAPAEGVTIPSRTRK